MTSIETRRAQPTVAVLGTGRMGSAIACRLLATGFAVRVWNRTPIRSVDAVVAGALPAWTPVDAAARADVVLTTINGGEAVASVMTSLGGALDAMRPGSTWIQIGQVSPSLIAKFELTAAARAITFVEALALGGDGAARAGKLLVLAAGGERARAQAAPVFDAIGRQTVWAASPHDERIVSRQARSAHRAAWEPPAAA
jgi:3-hydroxyisobutyrate dehydrogenase